MVSYTRCGDSIFIYENGKFTEVLELGGAYIIVGDGKYDLSKLFGGRRGILDGIFDLERDRKDHHPDAPSYPGNFGKPAYSRQAA